MKRLIFVFLVILIRQAGGQQIILLSVDQPLELGYAILENDTTIRKGESVIMGSNLTVFGGTGLYSYNWEPRNSLDNPAVKNPVATPEDTITYLVTVSDASECSFTVHYTVNVKRDAVKGNLVNTRGPLQAFLFPNPGKEEFRIRISGPPCNQIELTVTDYSGRVFRKEIHRNFEGELTVVLRPGLARGIYLVRIGSENSFITKELVIR